MQFCVSPNPTQHSLFPLYFTGLSSRAITQGLPFKKWIHPTPCITDRLSRRVFFKPVCTCMCTRSNSQLTSDTSTDVKSRSAKPFDLINRSSRSWQSELRKLLRKCDKMAGEQLSACCSNGTLWVMSKATKRKHVTREVLEDFVEPTQEQQIVKVSWAIAFSLFWWQLHSSIAVAWMTLSLYTTLRLCVIHNV